MQIHRILPLIVLTGTLTAVPAQSQFSDRIGIGNLPFAGAFDIAAIDIDNDGDLELFCTSADRILQYTNSGFGGFGNGLEIATGQGTPLGIVAADVDADGDEDLVYATRFGGAVRWLEQLPGFQWAAPEDVGPLVGAWEVDVGDIDGDGRLDVVASGFDSNEVVWFRQGPTGTFEAPDVILAGVLQPTEVKLADLNGDGDLDVVTGSLGAGQVVYAPSTSAGAFGAPVVITTAVNRPWSVDAADLDGDGHFDVLSASQFDNKVAWYRNLGGGVFGNQALIDNAASQTLDAEAVDINLDGRLDVAVASSGVGGIRWYENLGSGFFGPPMTMPDATFAPSVVRALDLDGDFDIDLVHGEGFWNENEAAIGAVSCSGVANSTGVPAELIVSGSPEVSRNGVALTAVDLPQFSFTLFLTSMTPGSVPGPGGSQGTLCLGGAIGRFNQPGELKNTGPLDSVRLRLDLNQLPTPNAFRAAQAGETWYFQAWHRDVVSGAQTSNFTSAVGLTLQ